MSLPNYIVNLEEFVESILKAYYNARLYKGGVKKEKGIIVETEGQGEYTYQWELPEDSSLSTIMFTPKDIRNIGYKDSWKFLVNDKVIYDNIYVKEMSERKNFFEPLELRRGDTIEFRVNRMYDTPMSYMWDIGYFMFKPIGVAVVVCVDEATDSIIYHDGLIYPPEGEFTVTAPDIEGYNSIETEKQVEFMKGQETQVVYFYYSGVL